MICAGLQTLLLANTNVTDLVGTEGVFVTAAKQGTDMPYVILDLIDDRKYKAFDGFVGALHCEIDIYCYDTTPQDAKALAKVIDDYLDDFSGSTGGSETIKESNQVGRYNTYSEPQSGGEISEWVTILNFEFQYTE